MTDLTQAQIDEGTRLLAELLKNSADEWDYYGSCADDGCECGNAKTEIWCEIDGHRFNPDILDYHKSRDDLHLALVALAELGLFPKFMYEVYKNNERGYSWLAPTALQFQCAVEVVKEYKAAKEANR